MNVKSTLIILAFAVVFVLGLFAGHYDVIKHQSIMSTDTEYIVNFDGNYYTYSK